MPCTTTHLFKGFLKPAYKHNHKIFSYIIGTSFYDLRSSRAGRITRKWRCFQQKVFKITDPLIIIYNKVKALHKLATTSGNPFSYIQQINIGIQLIKNFNAFEKGLTTWFDLPAVEKTWPQLHTSNPRELLYTKFKVPLCVIQPSINMLMKLQHRYCKNFAPIDNKF